MTMRRMLPMRDWTGVLPQPMRNDLPPYYGRISMTSYIRAIRWGSDRLGDAGVMAYVSGSAWPEQYDGGRYHDLRQKRSW